MVPLKSGLCDTGQHLNNVDFNSIKVKSIAGRGKCAGKSTMIYGADRCRGPDKGYIIFDGKTVSIIAQHAQEIGISTVLSGSQSLSNLTIVKIFL